MKLTSDAPRHTNRLEDFMDLLEAMRQRHAVRAYTNQPITDQVKAALLETIADCNREGGLHIQPVFDEPKAFAGLLARYGKFSGVKNYIAVIGEKRDTLTEACGYYGEKIVLKAQQLGLNTCWVALTYSKVKGAFQVNPGEKLCCVIAIGYGATQGRPHKSKAFADVTDTDGAIPDWFRRGVEAALLAPTALNQQKFCFVLRGNQVSCQPGSGFHTKLDAGIAKYHFAVGAGDAPFQWTSAVQ